MPTEVILPKVDMDMATGQISRWFVAEGATVRKGDTLFEIETDKAAMEIDAPASGIIRDITGKERVDIPVGQAVAWIYDVGEADIAPQARNTAVIAPNDTGDAANRTDGAPPHVNPPAGSAGRGGVSGLAADMSAARQDAPDGAVRATPLARRMARQAGIDIAGVSGSGPNRRVTRADVEALVNAPPAALPASSATPVEEDTETTVAPVTSIPKASEEPEGRTLKLFAPGSYDLVPHNTMRRTIARRLVEAKSTIPHFCLSLDCEIDALMSLRTELNRSASIRNGQPIFKLSVNDIVIKALALALRDVPEANVSWSEANLVRHRHVDVGVAVSVPGGLITPIIREAENKTLSSISSEMHDLAARARGSKLKVAEYQGGTTSVSNLGMFGIRDFTAIINPPQATILAVGAGEPRAIVRNGVLLAATILSVTLSVDHRAIDGALAAKLLSTFREYIERPLQLLV